MSKIFRFKQFSVDQTDCAMKVNTDAAILGAIADVENAGKILEIGTGTGVIALMIAQRALSAEITAVEINEKTAITADLNFRNSPFSERMHLVDSSFQEHFQNSPDSKYDLIISNPPYFINSLESRDAGKKQARHADDDFFTELVSGSARHLKEKGLLYLILPIDTAGTVKNLSMIKYGLYVKEEILIHSFPASEPYRCILVLGHKTIEPENRKFVIYEKQNVYTEEYRNLLKDYLTIF